MTIYDIVKKKPYLVWDIKNPEKLSEESILEHVLNFGNWDDVQLFISIAGLEKTHTLFQHSLKKRRINYTPQIQSYFTRYFTYHRAHKSSK